MPARPAADPAQAEAEAALAAAVDRWRSAPACSWSAMLLALLCLNPRPEACRRMPAGRRHRQPDRDGDALAAEWEQLHPERVREARRATAGHATSHRTRLGHQNQKPPSGPRFGTNLPPADRRTLPRSGKTPRGVA
jgi:hypothetical protein